MVAGKCLLSTGTQGKGRAVPLPKSGRLCQAAHEGALCNFTAPESRHLSASRPEEVVQPSLPHQRVSEKSDSNSMQVASCNSRLQYRRACQQHRWWTKPAQGTQNFLEQDDLCVASKAQGPAFRDIETKRFKRPLASSAGALQHASTTRLSRACLSSCC